MSPSGRGVGCRVSGVGENPTNQRPNDPTTSALPNIRAALDLLARVTAEQAGDRKLAELVTDHVLRHEDGNMLAAIVNHRRVPDKRREDCRPARPRLNRLLVAARVHIVDLLQKL